MKTEKIDNRENDMCWKGEQRLYNAVKWSPLGAETANEAVFWDVGRLRRANFSGSRPLDPRPIRC